MLSVHSRFLAMFLVCRWNDQCQLTLMNRKKVIPIIETAVRSTLNLFFPMIMVFIDQVLRYVVQRNRHF